MAAENAAVPGYETAEQVASRLSIDSSQVRRYCEQGRFEGAFKPHPRLWLIPRGAVPRMTPGRGRPPTWATPQTVGQIYGIPDNSFRRITDEEARGISLYPATPEHKGVRADVINYGKGMVPGPQELFSFRYVDGPTPLPAALFMSERGYAGALVVIYDYDAEGLATNFRTLRVSQELLDEGEAQVERMREQR